MALSGGFTRGGRMLGAAEGLGAVLVVTALVAALTYAATRPTLRARLDLTEGETFTLSDQTRSILRALEAPVTAVTILRPELQRVPNGLAEVQARAIAYVDNLLEAYALASGGQLTVRRLDLHAENVEIERLVQDLHLTRFNVVVIQGRCAAGRCSSRISSPSTRAWPTPRRSSPPSSWTCAARRR